MKNVKIHFKIIYIWQQILINTQWQLYRGEKGLSVNYTIIFLQFLLDLLLSFDDFIYRMTVLIFFYSRY